MIGHLPSSSPTVQIHDFVSIPATATTNMPSIHSRPSWILHQTSSSTLTLTSVSEAVKTTYIFTYNYLNFKVFWKRRKVIPPHVTVTKQTTGWPKKVTEFSSTYTEAISSTASSTPHHPCTIQNRPHSWQLLGPSRTVLCLTNEKDERVALFVFANGALMRSGAGNRPIMCGRVGGIHFVQGMDTGVEDILVSIVGMLEYVKGLA